MPSGGFASHRRHTIIDSEKAAGVLFLETKHLFDTARYRLLGNPSPSTTGAVTTGWHFPYHRTARQTMFWVCQDAKPDPFCSPNPKNHRQAWLGWTAQGLNGERAVDRDTLYLDLEDQWFARSGQETVPFIWLDEGESEGGFLVNAGKVASREGIAMKNTNTGDWREQVVIVDDFVPQNGGPKGADFPPKKRCSGDNLVVHLVEIRK